jgi:hypothetical protein
MRCCIWSKLAVNGGFCRTIFRLTPLFGHSIAALSSTENGSRRWIFWYKKTRKEGGRKPTPTYGIIDSQSVKTTSSSQERGFDGGKNKGRKRHIVVDIMGNLLAITVHVANIHDTKSGIGPARKTCQKYPTLVRFFAETTVIANPLKTRFLSNLDLASTFPNGLSLNLRCCRCAGRLSEHSVGRIIRVDYPKILKSR